MVGKLYNLHSRYESDDVPTQAQAHEYVY